MRVYDLLCKGFQCPLIKRRSNTANARWDSTLVAIGGRGIHSLDFKVVLAILSLLVMPFLSFSRENLNNQYLKKVRNFADRLLEVGTDQNGGDPYYEAKLGIGDLLRAFLRLHLSLNPEISLNNTL
ncbi:MAG: hypothetical protein KAQ79_04615 [Cyclobacteriaceae bacterium]|nr:hypothetical protein [Cyclobacteriaceae bacterium]